MSLSTVAIEDGFVTYFFFMVVVVASCFFHISFDIPMPSDGERKICCRADVTQDTQEIQQYVLTKNQILATIRNVII